MADSPESDPERMDLSAFEVPPLPPGLADRVLARIPATPRRARSGPWTAVAAGVLLLLGGGAYGVWVRTGEQLEGDRRFVSRDTVHLGPSALAVAEPGARLRWSAGRRGPVRVGQPEGRVFYRVEPGTDFQVDTPAGQVSVRGTCFTLEVLPMRSIPSALTGAAVGAALTASVFLTVHEGQVLATNTGQALELGPGERAELRSDRAPNRLPEPPAPTRAVPASPPRQASPSEVELATLRARVKELESRAAVSKLDPLTRLDRWLHPSPEELQVMAKECRVRWDQFVLSLDPMNPLSPKVKERLGMTEAEADVVAEVTAAFNSRAIQRLRAIYLAATGDEENARVLSPQSMNMEIFDKSPQGAFGRTLQRISRERAGLEAPPPGTTSMNPVEQLVRFNTSLGDDYEHALTEKLGATRAHALRLGLAGGNVENAGCPDSE